MVISFSGSVSITYARILVVRRRCQSGGTPKGPKGGWSNIAFQERRELVLDCLGFS